MNRDLSARVRASELLSTRLKAVFASLSEGIVMQDAEGRIVLINKSAEVLLGSIKNFWDSELGRLFNSAHTYPTTAVVSYSEREEGRTVTEMELIGVPLKVAVNNKVIGAQLALVSSVDGERLGTVIVLRDVTEEALAARLKDEFVTAITHELRTPLTAIKGMSEVLMSQPPDRPPNRKFLEAIGRNAAILDRMIIELLDISEMSAGNFAVHQKRIALDEVALDVIKSQEGRIKKQGIRVGVMVINRSRVYAIGDDQRLRWAVGHLLDNALHYTLKGGLITIRIGVVKADRVQLEVVDSGVGIADKDLPHIFDRFYRGEARTPEGKVIDPRGLGQGLYVARAVAEAHQGYLTVRSKVGEGSTFTLGLPLAPATD
jgi:signal transduction histidine kinase